DVVQALRRASVADLPFDFAQGIPSAVEGLNVRTTTKEWLMRQLTFTFLILALVSTAAAAQQEPPVNPSLPVVVTTGEATIRRVPNQASVSVSVETRARTPRDAQKQNADAMSAVQQKLVEAGIQKEAIRTTGYSIQQEFDFTNGRRVPRDYFAHNG